MQAPPKAYSEVEAISGAVMRASQSGA